MRVALVHDWLNTKVGGAEKVLQALAALYPEAPIYTLIYDEAKFGVTFPKARVRTSYLQRAPDWLKRHPRYLLPLIPAAVESFDFSEFDLVISSSAAYVKNIITKPRTLHISYCHTPMRFVWDYWPQYLQEQRVGPLRAFAIRQMVSHLRIWDYAGTSRVDLFISNSKTTTGRIHKYYQRDSQIIYPPAAIPDLRAVKKEDYYVTLAMLTPYKKLDLAIEAFNISGQRLLVIGDGPDRERLQHLAEPNVEFKGYVDETVKQKLLAHARGLIFPNEEDFGIAPVEAMALGTPVIAYDKGGVTETVIEGKTGVFFKHQSVAAINQAIEKAEQIDFRPATLHHQAARFGPEAFASNITKFVNKAYDHHVKTN